MKLYFSAAMKPQTNNDKAAVRDSRSEGNWRQGTRKRCRRLRRNSWEKSTYNNVPSVQELR